MRTRPSADVIDSVSVGSKAHVNEMVEELVHSLFEQRIKNYPHDQRYWVWEPDTPRMSVGISFWARFEVGLYPGLFVSDLPGKRVIYPDGKQFTIPGLLYRLRVAEHMANENKQKIACSPREGIQSLLPAEQSSCCLSFRDERDELLCRARLR